MNAARPAATRRTTVPASLRVRPFDAAARRLATVALVACAAALAAPRAAAEIVCRLTPGVTANITGGDRLFNDVDDNGQDDFQIQGINGTPPGGGFNPIFIVPLAPEAGTCGIFDENYVAQFAKGEPITGSCPALGGVNWFGGLQGNGQPGGYLYINGFTSAAPFVGVQVLINGQLHWGWLEFSTQFNAQNGECIATLKAIAYENTPLTAIPAGEGQCLAEADLDGDRDVDGEDLGALLVAWGGGPSLADLNVDGEVDGGDLGILLSLWLR